jgi:hypothetical protein
VAVDSDAVDPVDAERTGGKRRHCNRRGDNRVDLLEQLQKRRAQAVAAIAGLDIVDAAVSCALRHHVAVVAVGGGKRDGVAA